MTESKTPWRSPDALQNQVALRQDHEGAFHALGEVDALGHRIMNRVTGGTSLSLEQMVGLAFVRRAATLLIGTRTLLEGAAVEPAKLSLRAQFELMLATRYLVHGGRREVDANTATYERTRNVRARYFVAATVRAKVYRRQALLDRAWDRQAVQAKTRRRLKAEIEEYIGILERQFPSQHEAWGRFRCYPKKGKRKLYFDDRNWYSFGFHSSNVNSVRKLAQRLGYLKYYDFLYAPLSALTHPQSHEQDLRIKDGHAELFTPYLADAFDLVCFYGIGNAIMTFTWLAKAYSPQSREDVRKVLDTVRKLTESLNSEVPLGYLE